MSQPAANESLTFQLAEWIATIDQAAFSPRTYLWAKHGILDWVGVAIAGAGEPLVDILVEEGLSGGQRGDRPLLGRSEKMTPAYCALINGAASHALDYDDVNKQLGGHPTVGVVPAIVALAGERRMSGREFLAAYIVGCEISCQIGQIMGRSHYEDGWHNTGTIGTFGAAAAGCWLLGLDATQTAVALGLAGTQAAALKSMFGSMAKPLHAGKAAMNGLLSARLAARGFTAKTNVLEAPQGFGDTQSTSFVNQHALPPRGGRYAVENNLFKYHAACFNTHASIDALNTIRRKENIPAADIVGITTRVGPGHAKVCCIEDPKTPLEVKFSLKQVLALTLLDVNLADEHSFDPEVALSDPAIALRKKIKIEFEPEISRSAANLRIDLRDGSQRELYVDVGIPAEDVEGQWKNLSAKFMSLVSPRLGADGARRLIDQIAKLDEMSDPSPIFESEKRAAPKAVA